MIETLRYKSVKWVQILHFYPGLLMFPMLFYILTQIIFNLSGIDFFGIAFSTAVLVGLGIPSLALALRRLIPEEDLE